MISLESVEKMLRETVDDSDTGGQKPPPANLPPPLFDPTTPAGVRPAPAQSAPKPATVTPKPAPAGASRFRFADMILPDGTVDTAAVYRFGKVPEVPLSAELILQALANLPPDIPELARHAAIQITVNSLTQAAGIPVDSVVGDARVRRTRLMQFKDAWRGEKERDEQPLRQAVAELETLIAAKRAELESLCRQLEERETKSAVTSRDCDTRLSALQEVIDLMEAKTPG